MTSRHFWSLTVALLMLAVPEIGRAQPFVDALAQGASRGSSSNPASNQPVRPPGQPSPAATQQPSPVVIVPTGTGPQLTNIPLTSPAEGLAAFSRSKGSMLPQQAAGHSRSQLQARGAGQTSEVSRRYRVQRGETLTAIAKRHGTTVGVIARANGLRSVHSIKQGQVLLIPGRALQKSALTPSPRVVAGLALSRAGLVWPARGVLTSRFGWRYRRHHDGIDVASPAGSPIYAVRGGIVTFSGWYYGYGRMVAVDHGAGMISVYGHTAKMLVKEGQRVQRGQIIALVGCTGRCSGPHLHFEVRVQGRAVNPLEYLR